MITLGNHEWTEKGLLLFHLLHVFSLSYLRIGHIFLRRTRFLDFLRLVISISLLFQTKTEIIYKTLTLLFKNIKKFKYGFGSIYLELLYFSINLLLFSAILPILGFFLPFYYHHLISNQLLYNLIPLPLHFL